MHLAAGIRRWSEGKFDLDRGNPPTVGMLAALPVMALGYESDWTRVPASFAVGSDFLKANGERSLKLVMAARLACIPFSVLGAIISYCWAGRLYGRRSAYLALGLWCFCPNILAHAPLVTADVATTAVGLAAFYAFWLWLRTPSWPQTVWCGVLLGLAESTKFVWLMLYALWPLIWVLWRLLDKSASTRKRWLHEAVQVGVMALASLYIINIAYGFTFTLQPIGDTGLLDHPSRVPRWDWARSIRAPLPWDYLRGLAEIQSTVLQKHRIYLHGEWSDGGWWHYYLSALAMKTPLAIWALFALSAVATLSRRGKSTALDSRQQSWRDEMFLILPVVGFLTAVSWSTCLNHFRYVMPILPFLFIWASKSALLIKINRRQWRAPALGGAALTWFLLSSVSVFPHSLSYFNELAGGPPNGGARLIDSNIDWGQDLLYLKQWLDEHPEARPLKLAYSGSMDPRLLRIEYTLPPEGVAAVDGSHPPPKLPPGWYAVSVNYLHGYGLFAFDGAGGTRSLGQSGYQYFRQFQPVGHAGWSIYIYRSSDF
ncbi:MAG: glycosyltransferase family 39 protein [Pirellulales bacterium]